MGKKPVKCSSNLLKNQAEETVSPFGFPVIEKSGGGNTNSLDEELCSPEPVDSEPEASPEELYRKKLLELERLGQEIERDAYAKGFAQGERDGLEYGQKTIQVIKSQIERITANLEEIPAHVYKDYRNWFIVTCIKAARRVVRGELAASPRIVARVVSSLLDEAEEHSTLTLYLHPLDIEFMEKRADTVIGKDGKHLKIKADPELERGGCRIESDIQLLDASVDSQFKILEAHLLKEKGPVEPEGTAANG